MPIWVGERTRMQGESKNSELQNQGKSQNSKLLVYSRRPPKIGLEQGQNPL